ncbi:MAG: sigma-70 family RNA polymerase sigma factor [Synergistaceae bacterium]|nr:sigma-70 family RNA polymerase sigma factor [Synergistaceae bacterium]
MSLDPEHEKNLWSLCSQGDLDAREELIVAYRPLVFWIAGKIHVNDSELRQDIIQEGMLALINAVDKFEPEREFKFSTYAWHKIHGQIINMLERSEKKAPVPLPDELLQVAEESCEYYDSSGEDWLDVAESISKLEGREAEIVSALFFEGKKPKEVAAEKKLDISHVYRLRRTAIAKIRACLGLETG